jgi:LysR family transcriptional regulator, hydrogen peroxide-inducible genes activator
MTLTQLSYIVAVERYRHFATAAEKSFVTQPTLSMQIHKLEEDLGVKLFDRSKSPVVPTSIGTQIVSQAKIILREAKRIEDLANLNEDELRGTFRIGVIPTVAPYLVPMFLREFMQKYPLVELVFEEVLTKEIVSGLAEDRIDVGILATPVDMKQVFTEDLFTEPFVAYLSESHPLAGKTKLTLDDLNRTNIWLLNEGHCFRDQTVKICKEVEESPRASIRFESGNLETLKKLVEQNFGMTLLPWLAIQNISNTESRATIVEFEEPIPSRKIRLAYSRKYLKQNLVQALLDEIKGAIPEALLLPEKKIVIE